MRNAGGNLRLRKPEDLFQNFVLRGGLFISVDHQVASRIPLPALRATLSPGEGIGKVEILTRSFFWWYGTDTPGGVSLQFKPYPSSETQLQNYEKSG